MILTTKIANALDDKIIVLDGVEYQFNADFALRDKKPMFLSLEVNAIEDGEWIHELSEVISLGQPISQKFIEAIL